QLKLKFESDLPFQYQIKVIDANRILLKLYKAKVSQYLRGAEVNTTYTLLNLGPSKLVAQGFIIKPFPGEEESEIEEILLQGPDLAKRTVEVIGATPFTPPFTLAQNDQSFSQKQESPKNKNPEASHPEDSATGAPAKFIDLSTAPSVSETSDRPIQVSRAHQNKAGSPNKENANNNNQPPEQGEGMSSPEHQPLLRTKPMVPVQAYRPTQSLPEEKTMVSVETPPNTSDTETAPHKNWVHRINGDPIPNRPAIANRLPQKPQGKGTSSRSSQGFSQSNAYSTGMGGPQLLENPQTSNKSGYSGNIINLSRAPQAFYQPYALPPERVEASSSQSSGGSGASNREKVVYKPLPRYHGGAPPISFTVSTTGETYVLPGANPSTASKQEEPVILVSQSPIFSGLPKNKATSPNLSPKAKTQPPTTISTANPPSNAVLKQAIQAYRVNQPEVAQLKLKEALSRETHNPALYAASAEIYLKLKKFPQAQQAYEKAAEYALPGTYEDRLAIALYRQGKTQEAIRVLKNLLLLKPEDVDAHYMIGTLYQQLGDHPQALPYLAKAEALNPNSADIHYNLGLAYEMEGQRHLAQKQYLKALEKSPNAKDYQDAVNRIKL
ncbi:MAG: tetratricopeptide repeat protein, partial [Cyanobacteria bacterium]|nr:tetratricopeptide repeat protein [Cyanobacteriota bacterium]